MNEQTRNSLIKHLPAIFHKRPSQDNEIPLREYLIPFEDVFTQFDQLLSTLDRFFAPELAPADEFLAWLATWVALPLDEEWTEDQQRRLIREAIELYRWRGSVYGLKRYLELYAGVPREQVEIEEARWPAGMQIGVASRIGGTRSLPVDTGGDAAAATLEMIEQSYYLVSTQTPTDHPPDVSLPELPDGTPLRLYYQIAHVERVDIEETGVRIHYRPPGAQGAIVLHHRRPAGNLTEPNIVRSSETIDYVYRRGAVDDAGVIEYRGGAFLIDRMPSPYRFIVNIAMPVVSPADAALDDQFASRLRNVLNLEKPAHTDYYLRFVPVKPQLSLDWMQIEVHSSIGLDTTLG